MLERRGVGLLQVAEAGLGQLALGDLAVAELDGRVAVGARRCGPR